MTVETRTTDTHADSSAATVRAFFDAVARHDMVAAGERLHPDATWNHRNQDRFGGVHRGAAGIGAFMSEAMELSQGTLLPTPQWLISDGSGRVVALIRLTAGRPDGRQLDGEQILVITVEGDRVRSLDHFLGDPAAVAAFWA